MEDLRAYIGKEIEVKIDRPLGSKHPKHNFIYPVNYGYVSETISEDGEEIDAYVLGVFEPLEIFKGRCIAIIHRLNDNDDKLIIVPEGKKYSNDAIFALTEFQERFFESVIFNKDKRRLASVYVNKNDEVVEKMKYIKDEFFEGDICFKNFIKVENPSIIEENGLCIQNTGYKWLEFYDYNKKFLLTAMYDENNEMIEYYFDIARGLGKIEGIPYQDDLYLDVVFNKQGKIILLDEDELKEAYDRKEITKAEFDEAYKIANDLIQNLKNNGLDLKKYVEEILKEFLNKEELKR